MEISKKMAMGEIVKSKRDASYFIRKYVKISHPMKGTIPFELFDFQEDLVKEVQGADKLCILKARQMGISTILAAYVLWFALFNKDKNIVILAIKLKTARNLVKKVRMMYDRLPDWIRKISPKKIDNVTTLELKNGSVVSALAKGSDPGRSEAISLLVIDEAAFVENMEEIWKSIFPTLSTGGQCIALSTPNGTAGWFYNTYTEAESGENDFVPIKLNWNLHPERDQAWFDSISKNMSRKDLAQEYECDFRASGNTFLATETIEQIEAGLISPQSSIGPAGSFWVWEPSDPSESYIISADVARGDAEDFSAFHVFRVSDFVQVAEFKGMIHFKDFAEFLDSIGRDYNDALMVVESNKLGYAVLEKLKEDEYPNLFYSYKGTGEVCLGHRIHYDNNVIAGIHTSVSTRMKMLNKLEELLRQQSMTLHSSRTADELRNFVWKDHRVQAAKGKNDDLVMSLAIGAWVLGSVFGKIESETKKTRKGLELPFIIAKKGDTIKPYDAFDGFGKDFGTKYSSSQRKKSSIKTKSGFRIMMPASYKREK